MNESMLLHHQIDQLNATYAAAPDEKRFDDWPLFFTVTATTKCRRARILIVVCRWL